jgi:hypothetical protein
MTPNMQGLRELTNAELDLVTGGGDCNKCETLLVPAGGGPIADTPVEQANACCTPAAGLGLNKGPCDNGARCDSVKY